MTTIVWFRQDLRLVDNPALSYAATRGLVLPVYILDEDTPSPVRRLGGASRWWLHHSLAALEQQLGRLVLRRGASLTELGALARAAGATAVVWNRCYEPAAIARDTAVKAALVADGLEVKSFNAALINEPWEIATGSGGPYKVYSPYWRTCLQRGFAAPLPRPALALNMRQAKTDLLDEWQLCPQHPNWAAAWNDFWQPGEVGAAARLDTFLDQGLAGYAEQRNRPDRASVSRLSPHLHFGEVSPRQIVTRAAWHAERHAGSRRDADKFISEIGWREFAYHLLYHFPTLPTASWKQAFDSYPWSEDAAGLRAWQLGRTGYPMVDAGMRELWATGYMHNRVRMIAASFLVKHLRIHWRRGEAWFWDTLVDADLANNAASWQWVTGSGADAAPYFRIFNPIEQGRKFDPAGDYVRRWCPELAALPNAYLHAPFEAPADVLVAAGIRLGETYPVPIVDHKQARAAALDGYLAVKAAGAEQLAAAAGQPSDDDGSMR